MRRYDLTNARWRKSSYSDGNGGSCVEVADGAPGIVPVRDSKIPDGPVVLVGPAAWTDFVDAVAHVTGR
jgi:hypothetical protein